MKSTSCSSCGRRVIVGSKTCPYCGEKDPASRLPKFFVVIVILFVVSIFVFRSNNSGNSAGVVSDSYSDKNKLLDICFKEIGLEKDSSKPVSMTDMKNMDLCLKKYGVIK